MHGGDRRLQRVGAEAPRAESALHQRDAFRDQCAVPSAAILLLQCDQITIGGAARRAARLLDQHERQHAGRLRLGKQLDQEARNADRLARKIGAGDRRAC